MSAFKPPRQELQWWSIKTAFFTCDYSGEMTRHAPGWVEHVFKLKNSTDYCLVTGR